MGMFENRPLLSYTNRPTGWSGLSWEGSVVTPDPDSYTPQEYWQDYGRLVEDQARAARRHREWFEGLWDRCAASGLASVPKPKSRPGLLGWLFRWLGV